MIEDHPFASRGMILRQTRCTMAFTEGTQIGPYDIVGKIGAGGMGEVWRARDSLLGHDVAIKALPLALDITSNQPLPCTDFSLP